MLQLQGVQGFGCSWLRRTLDNEEDAVSSAFPKGKQQGDYDVGARPHWRGIPWVLLDYPKTALNNKELFYVAPVVYATLG